MSMRVVAAVIFDSRQRVLLARRPAGKLFAGKLEFPGGKVEHGESDLQALQRELQEELNIRIAVDQLQYVMNIPWDYEQGLIVDLQIYKLLSFNGEAVSMEGQSLLWQTVHDLCAEDFPPANKGIVTSLQLPSCMAITGVAKSQSQFLQRFDKLLQRQTLVQLRPDTTTQHLFKSPSFWRAIEQRVLASSCQVMLNVQCFAHLSQQQLTQRLQQPLTPFCGWHFPSYWLDSAVFATAQLTSVLFSTSVHNRQQLQRANALNVDFIYLSPVHATVSHQQAQSLTWQGLQSLLVMAKMPCYALGGMKLEDSVKAQQIGAQGIAAISAFW